MHTGRRLRRRTLRPGRLVRGMRGTVQSTGVHVGDLGLPHGQLHGARRCGMSVRGSLHTGVPPRRRLRVDLRRPQLRRKLRLAHRPWHRPWHRLERCVEYRVSPSRGRAVSRLASTTRPPRRTGMTSKPYASGAAHAHPSSVAWAALSIARSRRRGGGAGAPAPVHADIRSVSGQPSRPRGAVANLATAGRNSERSGPQRHLEADHHLGGRQRRSRKLTIFFRTSPSEDMCVLLIRSRVMRSWDADGC